MVKTIKTAGAFGAAMLTVFGAGGAAAQSGYEPGSEIRGHSIQVDAGGDVNTVYFDADGTARIVSQSGLEAQGRWFTENQSLCLQTGADARECWPYRAAFQAGRPVTLTSSCAVTSVWTPVSTEAPPPPPVMERRGERG